MRRSEIDAAAAALRAASSLTILCHTNPDADAVGSALALAIALDRVGKSVTVGFDAPGDLQPALAALPGQRFVAGNAVGEADLIVAVDCGSADRVGTLQSLLNGPVLVIDHHVSNTRFGTVNLVDPDASSTTTLIALVLDALQLDIDADIAHCLYAGLVADTGSFRWSRPGAHSLAERLLATGIDSGEITRSLLDVRSVGWLRLVSRVLDSVTLVPEAASGNGLVYALATADDLAGTAEADAESLVDLVRMADEAVVAAVLKEREPGFWTVSLRSRPGFDVGPVAVRLGGGGHRFAAGYSAHGSRDTVVAGLLAALR